MKALMIVAILLFLIPLPAFAVEAGKTVEYDGGTLGKVVFSGADHAGVSCDDCHDRIFKKAGNTFHMTSRDHIKGKLCAACHNGGRAFDARDVHSCDRCHQRN